MNSFPIAQRGFAVGVWGFAHGFGLLFGPLFAAWMMEIASWRWVFWVAVPLTALVIAVTLAATRGYKSLIATGKYDWLGLIIGGTGITLLTYGLQNASESWTAWATLGSIAGGIARPTRAVRRRGDENSRPTGGFRSLEGAGCSPAGSTAESAVGFVYIPFLTFVGSLFFINVLNYSPAKASWVIVITTGVCMVFEPPAGKWVDKIGPGIPITVALLMQAAALAWIGIFWSPDTTLVDMIVPLALMGIGVGISLPACNTAGMSAVDSERAGMGSGLMQMTFNIPAALGVALVTSVIGTLTSARMTDSLGNRPELHSLVHKYAHAIDERNNDAGGAAP